MMSFIGTGKRRYRASRRAEVENSYGLRVILFARMEGSTLTRPEPGPGPGARLRAARTAPRDRQTKLALAAFAVLCLGFAIGFLVFPTYPVYDSYYDLLWGRDLLHGHALVFQGFRYPTEHPLAIGAGALLSLFGDVGDRIWIAMIFATFLALVAGLYRLGRLAATPLVGAIAAAFVLTRFDYPFLAARGYVDIPYMAFVVWAAVLEGTRPRRGTPVFLLLAGAGLLRPEAWAMAAAYWVWMAWHATWPERIRYAALAAIGPVVWAGVDTLVTGDPLFSLHYTSGSAEDLGRQKSLADLPAAVPGFFNDLVKLPVLLAAVVGMALGVVISPRRMVMPALLLGAGLGTFILIGIAGASVIERYLAVSALALMVFGAIAVGGWTMLAPGRVRTGWIAAAALVVLGGLAFTVTHLNLSRFDNELRFRGLAHNDLKAVLHNPRVQAGLRCGPLTTPNHKLVPDSRWVAGLGDNKVLARAWVMRIEQQEADFRAGRQGAKAPKAADLRAARSTATGVAIVVTSRFAIFKHAYTDVTDSPLIEVPPAGFKRVATSRFYAAYVRC
jgi:hypothetical protein